MDYSEAGRKYRKAMRDVERLHRFMHMRGLQVVEYLERQFDMIYTTPPCEISKLISELKLTTEELKIRLAAIESKPNKEQQ